MQADKLTAQAAESIERAVITSVNGFIVEKNDVPLMGVVRAIFDEVSKRGVPVPNGEAFDRTSHAIGMLYIRAADMSPADRIGIAVHEGAHVQQFWSGEFTAPDAHGGRELPGGLSFAALYATVPLARIRFEVRAERARWEVLHALGLPLPTIDEAMHWLFSYYALPQNEELRAFARLLIESNIVPASLGIVQNQTALVAIRGLKAHGVIA